jgi:hypothetical protein
MEYFVTHGPLVAPEVNAATLITNHMTKAQEAYRNSRDSAAKAAAHAYLVWLKTLSTVAEQEARDWMIGRIESRNYEIDAHNAEEDTLKKRVSAHKNARLADDFPNDILLKTEFATADEKELFDAELERVKALHELKAKDWANRRKVRIDARGDKEKFSVIVKYVFKFETPPDSSVASRYSQVLQWINDNTKDREALTADHIVALIQAAGGFEKVVFNMRGKWKGDATPRSTALVTSGERKVMEAHIAQKATEAAQRAPALATVELALETNSDGLVMIVGRKAEQALELVGPLRLDKQAFSSAVSHFAFSGLHSSSTTELFARLLEFGEMVSDGEATGKTENDLKMGVPLDSERVIVLLPYGETGCQLLASTRVADASVLVKATPKVSDAFGTIDEPVMLDGAKVASLKGLLGDDLLRRLITMNRDHEKPSFVVTLTNAGLTRLEHPHAKVSVDWIAVSGQSRKPLNVDGFRPSVQRLYTREELLAWYGRDFAKKHAGAAAKAKREAVDISVDGNSVLAKTADGTLHYVDSGKQAKAPVKMKFDLAMFADCLEILGKQEVFSFRAMADDGGLLSFSWEDELASWELYLPTLTADGQGLQSRRLAPMRVETDTGEEADPQVV